MKIAQDLLPGGETGKAERKIALGFVITRGKLSILAARKDHTMMVIAMMFLPSSSSANP